MDQGALRFERFWRGKGKRNSPILHWLLDSMGKPPRWIHCGVKRHLRPFEMHRNHRGTASA